MCNFHDIMPGSIKESRVPLFEQVKKFLEFCMLVNLLRDNRLALINECSENCTPLRNGVHLSTI